MRTKYSIRNIITTSLSYFVSTITGLILRKMFLRYIGLGYSGLDSVYTNILSFLGLAELGIGAAITYKLYKPLAEGNYSEVSSLMAVYKMLYRIIAIVVLAVGTILSIFLKRIVKDPPIVGLPLTISYFLFLASSVCSYLFAYKRSLILADQRQYIVTLFDTGFNILFFMLKLFVVWKYNDYFMFLVLGIIRVVIGNLAVSLVCSKKYPQVFNQHYSFKDTIKYARGLIKDFEYILLHKVCGYVYSSTDAIVISMFMGVDNVGLLGNYNLIVSVVNSLFSQCSSSIQSSVGNLVYTSSNKLQIKQNVYRLSYLYHFILSFFCTCLFCLLTPFVILWIGNDYILPQLVVMMMCLNMYVFLAHQPIANLYTATGLYKYDKFTSAIAAVVNLSLSIILVNKYGFIGVYIGTALGSVAYLIGRTIVVYKNVFNEKPVSYLLIFLKYILIASGECFLTYVIVQRIAGYTIGHFILKAIVCIVVPNLFNVLLFWRTDEFKYCVTLLKSIFNKAKSEKA